MVSWVTQIQKLISWIVPLEKHIWLLGGVRKVDYRGEDGEKKCRNGDMEKK